jgi:formamidopyrimidine-DNA glycosylase
LHLHSAPSLPTLLAKLGPDPFDPELTPERFAARLHKKRSTLKATLVDQSSVVSGIGNCYSDEICFHARLLPTRKTTELGDEETVQLYRSMREVLLTATEAGGYMDVPLFEGDTHTGAFDAHCAVYDRGGKPCVHCGSPIVFAEVNSKKCFYCTNCQS